MTTGPYTVNQSEHTRKQFRTIGQTANSIKKLGKHALYVFFVPFKEVFHGLCIKLGWRKTWILLNLVLHD